jgi:phosphoribosylformylglycinamidine synthase
VSRSPRFGVIRFPGSNCDQDAFHVIKDVLQCDVDYLWHEDRDLKGSDIVVLPGGFSYGDYLRCGAVARFAPVMDAVQTHASRGGIVLGICNGFQILCEAHMLPGALVRNANCKFICQHVMVRVENTDTPFTMKYEKGAVASIPIAHGEGCYVAEQEVLDELESSSRVIFRYTGSAVESRDANPNGSLNNIAGICSAGRNVLGMMPHPERACNSLLGSADGLALFQSLTLALQAAK